MESNYDHDIGWIKEVTFFGHVIILIWENIMDIRYVADSLYNGVRVPNKPIYLSLTSALALGVLVSSLIISYGCGSSSSSGPSNQAPSASFSYSPLSPSAGQSVQFTDTSQGNPTAWQWSFGDGLTSADKNPAHIFATPGSMTVSLTVSNASGSDTAARSINVITGSAIIIDHATRTLASIPSEWITKAKQTLHIAYGHTSHGSQQIDGMTGLVQWRGTLYAWNNGGTGGALDLRDFNHNFGNLGIACDLGARYPDEAEDYTAWNTATRLYLAAHPEINVIIWAWCYQMNGLESNIHLYLDQMNQLEEDFPNVKFVYMTGHVTGDPWGPGTDWAHNYYMRCKQIRDYCAANNKILYDFGDIESWDPDGVWYGDKLVNENCDYDANGDGVRERNWAIDWQNAHPGEWYNCISAHSQPLNANLKAYAAWWLWARLAGWDGK